MHFYYKQKEKDEGNNFLKKNTNTRKPHLKKNLK